MTAGLPARCKLFISLVEREQGAERPGYCRALVQTAEGRLGLTVSRRWLRTADEGRDFRSLVTRLLPMPTGFCTSRHPERTE